jgi:peptidoglycan/LPS O-acetylase OafA/YrhL
VKESPNLDVLRAIAVLSVYFAHLLATLKIHISWDMGEFGVLIFFVHTSLVLMMSLERIQLAGRPLFTTFYVRRFFRIYPLSVLCVSLIVLFHLPRGPLGTWGPWSNPDLSTIIANLLLCMNLFQIHKIALVAVLWSLPYEVEMYILLPFLFLAGKLYGFRGILVLLCAAVAIGVVQPYIAWRLDIAQYGPCFLAGVASYFLGFGITRRRLPFLGWPVVIATAAAIYACGSAIGVVAAARWIACVWIGLTAPFFADLKWPALRESAAWVAKYSYGIYLTHLYAMWTAFDVLKNYAIWFRFLALVALSIGLPALLYHVVESPMIKVGLQLSVPSKKRSLGVVLP